MLESRILNNVTVKDKIKYIVNTVPDNVLTAGFLRNYSVILTVIALFDRNRNREKI